MTQITEDYVSFEVAKLLKEKGFEQACDYATSWYAAQYYKNSAQGEWFEGEHEIIKDLDDKCTISYLSDEGVFIPAPTQSLALKWLREVHGFIVTIDYDRYPVDNGENDVVGYGYNIQTKDNPEDYYRISEYVYDCYEEATEAALLYVLKNLI